MYPLTQKLLMHLFLELLFREITEPFVVISCSSLPWGKKDPPWLCPADGFQLGHSSLVCLFPALCLAGLCSLGCGEDTYVLTPSASAATAGSTGHFQGLLMPSGATLLFFQSSFIATKDSFAKCMQAIKVRHWQLVSHFHYSSFTGNFSSTCGGIHSVIPLKN